MADIEAWAERSGLVLVDRTDFEADCAELASLIAKEADIHSDFDRFLLSL